NRIMAAALSRLRSAGVNSVLPHRRGTHRRLLRRFVAARTRLTDPWGHHRLRDALERCPARRALVPVALMVCELSGMTVAPMTDRSAEPISPVHPVRDSSRLPLRKSPARPPRSLRVLPLPSPGGHRQVVGLAMLADRD